MKSTDVASDATPEFSPEDSETTVTRGRRNWFRPEWFRDTFPFLFLFLIAGCLRFWDLGVRPLHWDESLHGYFALQMLNSNIKNWASCIGAPLQGSCYRYTPLLHGPFQFFAISIVYGISQLLQVADHGVNTTTVRIVAALMGSLMVLLPYYVQDYLGRLGAVLASLFLTLSPSFVYYSRFAREDIYMAFFTLWMVVAVARYVRERKLRWLLALTVALTLSYVTNEATFLTIGIFGSFLLAVLVWEIFVVLPFGDARKRRRFQPRTNAPLALIVYFLTLIICAKIFLGYISSLSHQMSVSGTVTQEMTSVVDLLEQATACFWPFVVLGFIFFLTWLTGRGEWRMLAAKREQEQQQDQVQERKKRRRERVRVRGWKRIFVTYPQRQPLWTTILNIPRVHWLLVGTVCVLIFTALFSALFTYFPQGPADGVWQGLFYWTQQQAVARGAQPWFYYSLLIFLYEQIGLVFGIVGIVRSLYKPTVFRLFLVYWFVASLIIYSWAGEKMPWLVIHIVLPLLLLAAVGLEPVLLSVVRETRAMRERWRARSQQAEPTEVTLSPEEAEVALVAQRAAARRSRWTLAGSLATCLAALLLLTLTLQNMYQLSFVHEADAPYEMMIYVQTTTSVNTVLGKVTAVDKFLYQGKDQLPIGVTSDSTWPFAWYLRDDTRTCYVYTPQTYCGTSTQPPVIITAQDDISSIQKAMGSNYVAQEYQIRSQWDQGYMPPLQCKSTPGHTCPNQPYVGVGLLLWLSYGDKPPAHAQFNVLLAMEHIWNWWLYREPIGSSNGGYNMWLLIRKDVVQSSGIHP